MPKNKQTIKKSILFFFRPVALHVGSNGDLERVGRMKKTLKAGTAAAIGGRQRRTRTTTSHHVGLGIKGQERAEDFFDHRERVLQLDDFLI